MMFTLVKDLLNIPVITSVTLAILAAIAKKYVHFSRRDFFSRSPLEQIEAVKWLRHSKPPSSDPLDVTEQQFRLLSLGLHRDRDLSYRLVAFIPAALKPIFNHSKRYYVGRDYMISTMARYTPIVI